jgi:hypothetical protein
MKTPRNLNGADFADTLIRKWDYVHVHQTGSHIIIETERPFHQRLSIPNHKPFKAGTLTTLLRLAAEHKRVSKEDMLKTLEETLYAERRSASGSLQELIVRFRVLPFSANL